MSLSRARPSIRDIRCSLSLCKTTVLTQSLQRQRHSLHCLQNPRFHGPLVSFPTRSVHSALSSVATTRHVRNRLHPPASHPRNFSRNQKSKSVIFKEKAEERERRRAAKESGDYDPAQWTARSSARSSDHVRKMPLHKWRRFEKVKRLESDFQDDLELEMALQQRKPGWVRRKELREETASSHTPVPRRESGWERRKGLREKSGSSAESDPRIRQVNSNLDKDGRLNETRLIPAKWAQLAKQVNERKTSRSIVLDGGTPSHHQIDGTTDRVTPIQENDTHPLPPMRLGERIWGRRPNELSNVVPPSKGTDFFTQKGPGNEYFDATRRNLLTDPKSNTTFSVQTHFARPPPVRPPPPRRTPLRNRLLRKSPPRFDRGAFNRDKTGFRRYPEKKPLNLVDPEFKDGFWIRDVDADVPEAEKARRYYDFDPELLDEFARTTANTSAGPTTRWDQLRRMKEEQTLNVRAPSSENHFHDSFANQALDFPTREAMNDNSTASNKTSMLKNSPTKEDKKALKHEERRRLEERVREDMLRLREMEDDETEDAKTHESSRPEPTASENLSPAEVDFPQPHQSIQTETPSETSWATKRSREAAKLQELLKQMHHPRPTLTEKQVVNRYREVLISTYLESLPFGPITSKRQMREIREQKTREAEQDVRAQLRRMSKRAPTEGLSSSLNNEAFSRTQTAAPKQRKSRQETEPEPTPLATKTADTAPEVVEQKAPKSRKGSRTITLEASPAMDTVERALPKATEKVKTPKKDKGCKNTRANISTSSTTKAEAAQPETQPLAPKKPKIEQDPQLEARRAAKKAAEEHFARMTSLALEVEEKKRQIELSRQASSDSGKPIPEEQHEAAIAQADADARDGWAEIRDIRNTDRFKQLMADADIEEDDADDMEGWETIETGDQNAQMDKPWSEEDEDAFDFEEESESETASVGRTVKWPATSPPVVETINGRPESYWDKKRRIEGPRPKVEPEDPFPEDKVAELKKEHELKLAQTPFNALADVIKIEKKRKPKKRTVRQQALADRRREEEEDKINSRMNAEEIELLKELRDAQQRLDEEEKSGRQLRIKRRNTETRQRRYDREKKETHDMARMDLELKQIEEEEAEEREATLFEEGLKELEAEEAERRKKKQEEKPVIPSKKQMKRERLAVKANEKSELDWRNHVENLGIEQHPASTGPEGEIAEHEEREKIQEKRVQQGHTKLEKVNDLHAASIEESPEEHEEQEELLVLPSKNHIASSIASVSAKADQQSERDRRMNAERLEGEQQTSATGTEEDTVTDEKRLKAREKRKKNRQKAKEKRKAAHAALLEESPETQTEEAIPARKEVELPKLQVDEKRPRSKKRREKLEAYAAAQEARQLKRAKRIQELEQGKRMLEAEIEAEAEGLQTSPDKEFRAETVAKSQETNVEDMDTAIEEDEQQDLNIDELRPARAEADENFPDESLTDEEIIATAEEEVEQERLQRETSAPASASDLPPGAVLIGDGKKYRLGGKYYSLKTTPKAVARRAKRRDKRHKTKANRAIRMAKHKDKIDEMIAQDPNLTRIQALTKIYWDDVYRKQEKKHTAEALALKEAFNIADVEGHSSRKIKNMAMWMKKGKNVPKAKLVKALDRLVSKGAIEEPNGLTDHTPSAAETKFQRLVKSDAHSRPPKDAPSANPSKQPPEAGPNQETERSDKEKAFDTSFQTSFPSSTLMPDGMRLTPRNAARLEKKAKAEAGNLKKLQISAVRQDKAAYNVNKLVARKLGRDLNAENLREFFKQEQQEEERRIRDVKVEGGSEAEGDLERQTSRKRLPMPQKKPNLFKAPEGYQRVYGGPPMRENGGSE